MGTTEIIPLADGILVEVDLDQRHPNVATVGELASRGWNELEGILRHITGPFVNVYRDLAKDASISEIGVEIGLSFEAGGSVFVVKAGASANVKVSVKLKPAPIVASS